MGYRYRPSKAKVKQFIEDMDRINEFCVEHGIDQSRSGDSYYFTINGTRYRVSNHTIAASNAGAYTELGEKVREKYHPADDDIICITAGKTRIEQIYNDLKAGKKLDKRGNERKY